MIKLNYFVFALCLYFLLTSQFLQSAELDFSDIEELRKNAIVEGDSKEVATDSLTADTEVFVNRGLGLQKLNPEISITGDFLFGVSDQPNLNGGKTDFLFRGLGLHFESYLDPYTRLKAAVPVSENGAELGGGIHYFLRCGSISQHNNWQVSSELWGDKSLA